MVLVKRETRGFVDGVNDEIKAEEANNIRNCMKPYISTLLAVLLE